MLEWRMDSLSQYIWEDFNLTLRKLWILMRRSILFSPILTLEFVMFFLREIHAGIRIFWFLLLIIDVVKWCMFTCSMYTFSAFGMKNLFKGFETSFPLQFWHNQKQFVRSYVQSHLSLTQISDRFLLYFFFPSLACSLSPLPLSLSQI